MEAQSKRNNERAAATASRIFVPIQVESPIRRIYLCERGTLDTARRADIETDRESESKQSQYDALHVARLNTQLETTKNKLKHVVGRALCHCRQVSARANEEATRENERARSAAAAVIHVVRYGQRCYAYFQRRCSSARMNGTE